MMNYVSMMPHADIANVLAEDVGAPELRNPLNSGMRSRLLPRLRVFFSHVSGKQVC